MNKQLLLDNLRTIPDFPKKGINFRDVTTLYKNGECMREMTEALYELYKDKGITKIVGVESRGFVMASALAARLGCGVVLARKPGKLPATVIKESFSKEYGVDTVEMHIDSITSDDVVLIHAAPNGHHVESVASGKHSKDGEVHSTAVVGTVLVGFAARNVPTSDIID